MWALRRVSIPLRNQSNFVVVARTCCASKDIASGFTEKGSKNGINFDLGNHVMNIFPRESALSPNTLFWTRNLSSHIQSKSSDGEDELEDGFSDLELPPETSKSADLVTKDSDDISIEEEMSEEETVNSELGLLDDDIESKGKKNAMTKGNNNLSVFKLLLETPKESVNSALDKWVDVGKSLGKDEISLAILYLRKKKFYKRALQFYEWLEANKRLEFTERDHKCYLDLIAKVLGIPKAEKYITNLPESSRTEPIYRTLLANSVASSNIKKSEDIFNKIKDLGPITAFSCNQLLLLYKRVDRKKIADVLKLMEKENVKPSLFTYRLLVDVKGRAHDISGMENILELMKSEGMEPDVGIKSVMAKHYIFAGLKEKTELLLKEIEGEDVNSHRAACKELLPLYAALGKADDVARIWGVCESNPNLEECLACIEAWGKLGEIKKAESVFELMEKSRTRLSPRLYNGMIKVYANHKLLAKGKELAKKMSESGMRIGPLTLDALVKLHAEAGEVEKADSIVRKAAQGQIKPMYCSYMLVLEHYARRGDIHNAERMFHIIRQSGYIGRIGMYQTLLKAYQIAKAPIYGFRERLKADGMFPNKAVAAQLAAMDAFKKTEISELLD